MPTWTAYCKHCGAAFTTDSLADKTCSPACYDAWLTSLEVPGPSLPYVRSMHNQMRRERGIPERSDPPADAPMTHVPDIHPMEPEW